MEPHPPRQPAAGLFPDGGEMGALMRAKDWAATPLGPPEGWPQGLRTVVRILLTSRYAMWMGWGPDLTFLYNDAYGRMTLGKKHPWALGRPAREVWAEIWDELGPRVDSVLGAGTATWDEALLLFLERNGYPEETYHTFSYSPLADDHGRTAGLLCVVTEETERVIGERRVATLRDLASELAAARTEAEVSAAVERQLGANARDLPFTLTYLFGEDGAARLACRTGGLAEGDPAAPAVIGPAVSAPWPAAAVLAGTAPVTVDDLDRRFAALPSGAWDRPPKQAALVPIARQGQGTPAGFLVAGLNPYRPFDAAYGGFIDLTAGQIAAGFANARAYEEERKRADALAEIDRAKTAFFSNVSHEFRTPLTLMLGPLEDLLASAGLSGRLRGQAEVAHRNGLRLLKLVNSLLDFARIEAGRVRASYEPADLADLTAELASNFRSVCEQAGLTLTVDCPPLPEPVHVDRDMWEKIVLNLLSNAFKFTLEGGITVGLAARGGSAELTVADTGTGIPAHELPRLFERFHRVEGARGRSMEGSGIGLALVQELVRLHGGSVRAESEPGRGTRFTVTVPFGAAHLPPERVGAAPSQAPTAVRARAYVEEALRWLPAAARDAEAGQALLSPSATDDLAPQHAAPAGGGRVLLADDNADMRDYVARLLADRGYAVETAPDGEAALAALRAAPPDLVLSDVMMPRLDGFGLLRAIRADPTLRDLPVVLLSARAGEEARVEGLDAGADDYLTKPFAASELLARVGANIALARVRREAAEALRARTAELEALLETVPVGVWFTRDPEGREIWGNRRAAALMRMAEGANPSLTAPEGERPRHFRVFRGGVEADPATTPIRRAARGEEVRSDEQEIRFDDGSSLTLLGHATPLRDAAGRVVGAVAAGVDITERKRAEEHQQLLLAELSHRVKNTLAVVQGIAGRTLAEDRPLAEVRANLTDRLRALANTHSLLTANAWRGASLQALAEGELKPYGERAGVEGADLLLPPRAALTLGLVLHELATNAAKHGALSAPEGRVGVTWEVGEREGERRLRLAWRERGGPPVRAPTRRGFGHMLIERGPAHDLGGTGRLDFRPEGLAYDLDVPLDPGTADYRP